MTEEQVFNFYLTKEQKKGATEAYKAYKRILSHNPNDYDKANAHIQGFIEAPNEQEVQRVAQAKYDEIQERKARLAAKKSCKSSNLQAFIAEIEAAGISEKDILEVLESYFKDEINKKIEAQIREKEEKLKEDAAKLKAEIKEMKAKLYK